MPADRSLLLTSIVLQSAMALTFGLAFVGLWRGFRRATARCFATAWLMYGAGMLAAALANAAGVAETATDYGVLGLPALSGVILFSAGTDSLAHGDRAPALRLYFIACGLMGGAVVLGLLLAGTWLDTRAPSFPYVLPRVIMMAAYARAAWPLRHIQRQRWREGYALLIGSLALLSLRAGASALYETSQVVQGSPQTPESLLLTLLQLALLMAFGVATAVVLIEAEHGEAVSAAQTIQQTAEALRASEARFRFVVEHISDVPLVVGRDRRILYVAPSCERIVGVPPSAIEGRDLLDLLHGDDRAAALEAFARLMTVPPPPRQPISVHIQHASGEWLTFEVSGDFVPGYNGQSSTVVLSARDVTAQRQLEQEVLQRRRLDSLGQMAGSIAHDFNNMLTSIMGGLQYVREHMAPQSAAAPFLNVIEDAAKRGSALTRQLLSFARQAPLARVTFCVRQRLALLEGMLGVVVGRSIQLSVESDPGPLCVTADPNQFDQVLVNLAANARDAMPEGGRLTIRVTRISGRSRPALPASGSAPLVRVAVEDTGTGIAADAIDHIFEPFFTTKAEGRGSGLGLASAYGFANQAGGALAVESTPGVGSRFLLDLPLGPTPDD
jgi:PAS domain S-box-containing protein